MKLTIKTLQQSSFKIDIEPEKTVSELKDKIEQDHGKDYPKSAQKLIYSGKILADETKLSEYNIDEKKFIVLMIIKPPPIPKTPVAEKSTVSAKKEDSAASKPKASEDKPKTTSQSSSNTSTVSATSAVPPTATSNPNTITTTQQTQPINRTPARSSAPNESAGFPMSDPQMASRLASLVTQPQFRQMQDLIQQSPHMLSSTIEALSGSDPEMFNFISENPDVFVSALNHPPLAGSRSQSSRSSTTSGQQRPEDRTLQQAAAARNPVGRQPPAADQVVVDVSQHDKEAIERLKELGFSEYQALQAYMACDKDEQLAANLLFQMDQ